MGESREQVNIVENPIWDILAVRKKFDRGSKRKHCDDCPHSYKSCRYKTFNGVCSYE